MAASTSAQPSAAKQAPAGALAKVKGTVERTETDVDHGSPGDGGPGGPPPAQSGSQSNG